MKIFKFSLLLMAFACIAIGVTIYIFRIDITDFLVQHQGINVIGNAGIYAASGLGLGVIFAGFYLLVITLLLTFIENRHAGNISLPTHKFLIIVIGLQVIFAIICISNIPYKLTTDDQWYYSQAKNLAEGINPIWNHRNATSENGILTAFWPIGYAAFLSVFFRLFGPSILVGQILNIFLLSGITLLIYFLCKRFFDLKTARCSALVLAFMPSQVFYAVPLLSDLFFAFLTILFVYLAAQKISAKNTIFSGLIFGLAVLTRSIIFFLPLFMAVYKIFIKKQTKSALKQLASIYLLCEIILLPWQIRNYNAFGQFVLFDTHGGWNFWMGNNAHTTGTQISFDYLPDEIDMFEENNPMNEAQRDSYFFREGLAWAFSHPFKTILNWPKKFVHMYYRDDKCLSWTVRFTYPYFSPVILSSLFILINIYYYCLLFSFAISAWKLTREEKFSERNVFLLGSMLYFTIIYFPFITEGRYHLLLMPLFAMVVAATPTLDKAP